MSQGNKSLHLFVCSRKGIINPAIIMIISKIGNLAVVVQFFIRIAGQMDICQETIFLTIFSPFIYLYRNRTNMISGLFCTYQ